MYTINRTDQEINWSLLLLEGAMTPLRIKKIRKKYGINQTKFADLLTVAHITFSSWERGVRKPSSPSCALLQIAEKHPKVFLESRREIIEGVIKYFEKNKLNDGKILKTV